MKKIFLLIIIFIFLLFGSNVEAKTIKVISCENFSTANPNETFKVKILEEKKISKDLYLEPNNIIVGHVIRVYKPRRGKRDSYFELVPSEMIVDGEKVEINDPTLVGKIQSCKKLNPCIIVFKAGSLVVNFYLKGVINAAIITKGAIKNEYHNRIKSGWMEYYNSSFLTFVENGKELNITEGDILVLKIKKIH